MIWTITAYAVDPKLNRPPPFGYRVFGYYLSETEAREAVRLDIGGMHECLYTHLLIERVPPGIHAMAEVVAWYEWAPRPDDRDEGRWTLCSAPEWSVGVCNHSMG